MDFVPIRDPNKPQEEELRVQGWRWVNTNSISPTQFNTSEVKISAGKPDRLGTHSHHGLSTHRVISGDLRIRKYQNAGGMYELSSAPGCRRQDLVQPHVKYSGTSRNGCTFVEGQRCLSPESAERFLARGTLKVVDKTRPREYFPRADELRAWLLQVKFDPEGKAYPNLAKGEKPILDTSCASPPMPADVHADLSEWFEAPALIPSKTIL